MNASQNSDVFEVVRGGGTTLGVVVQLTVKLFDVSTYHGVLLSALDPSGSNLR